MSLLPQKEVVRTDLQPFEQETQPLAKIWCVKMEDDSHQPNELKSQMRVMRTYLKARYRLSNLLRAQRNDRMTSNLKRWIKNGSPDKGDLEEDSYRILRQYFMHFMYFMLIHVIFSDTNIQVYLLKKYYLSIG